MNKPNMPQAHHAWPLEHYHEDMGAVLWHRFPIEEAPWCGTPNDSDWPGYHTHFQPLPPEPVAVDPTKTLRQAINELRMAGEADMSDILSKSKFDHLYEGEPWAELVKKTGLAPGNTESQARHVAQFAADELARLRAEKAELVRDCEILLANLDWLTECFGEGPEDEDAVLVKQIRAKLARAQAEPPDSEGGL